MAVFLLDLVAPAFVGLNLALIPARLTGAAMLPEAVLPAIITPITMQFVHGGIGHLFINMLFLIFIGRFVEGLLGGGRYISLYLVCGIAGALLETALTPESLVLHVGASGAISGIFAAHVMIFGKRGQQSNRNRGLQLAAVWIGLQLMTGLVFNGGGDGGIAIWAHVGGFLTGLVLAIPLARAAIASR